MGEGEEVVAHAGLQGFSVGRGCMVQLHHVACTDGTLSNFNNGHLAIETV